MIRTAPAFWWRPGRNLAASALAPLGALVGAAAGRRLARPGGRAGVPVVCVGNFTVGGAGKTPLVLEIVHQLAAAGVEAAVLSRGYGGAPRRVPLRIVPGRHGAGEVGDEPLLLARAAPCYVSADRPAAARAAVDDGAAVLVMDDGLQNPSLAKDLRIAVVDGAVGVGNGLCLPAGPLRAPLRAQWPMVDLLVVIGAGAPGAALAAEATSLGRPVLRAEALPEARAVEALRGSRLVGFAGIGRPSKFFDTLAAAGLDVVERVPFPDHHAYGEADLDRLQALAARVGGRLVTTEKDRVRLPPGFVAATLPIRLAFDDPETLAEMLGRLVA